MDGRWSLITVVHVMLLSPVSMLAVPSLRGADFNMSEVLGAWHEVAYTTYMQSDDTLTSRKWSFVQGEDGTVLALFNAWCKSCGACSSTYLYTVERKDFPESPVALHLEGYGGKFSLWLESAPASELVVSMCLDPKPALPSACPQKQYRMSVLSRNSAVPTKDMFESLQRLPSDTKVVERNAGARSCPPLYINPELVTAEFAASLRNDRAEIQHIVSTPGSRVKLQCTVSRGMDYKGISWVREEGNMLLTYRRKRVTKDDRFRVRNFQAQPRKWELRVRNISLEDAGVFACVNRHNQSVARVVLSVAVPPKITKKSADMSVLVGSSIQLLCEVSGQPDPSVSWFFAADDKPRSDMPVADGKWLTVDNFRRTSQGRYTCRASNGIAPAAHAVIRVRALPVVICEQAEVEAAYGDSAVLTCHINTESLSRAWWRKAGEDIVGDKTRVIDLSRRIADGDADVAVLTLRFTELRKSDFGEYTCLAANPAGRAGGGVRLTETWKTGEDCNIDKIPVMPNFSIQRFLGTWERIETTTFMWGNKTYLSEVTGHFITISGNLVQYYRGYDPESEQCLAPGSASLVLLDTPGDYQMPFGTDRGRFKVVYTDYTHAVVYFCLSRDGQRTCPRNLLHVQILSRVPVIPDSSLDVLYRHLQRTCLPVSSLISTVPGLCQVPAEYVLEKGYIGHFPEPSCQVANLQVQKGLTPASLHGTWVLVVVVRPELTPYNTRSIVHIVPLGQDLAVFSRGFHPDTGLCSSPEVAILHRTNTAGSYYHDYNGLTKSVTVSSKVLAASSQSLVLYTCLAVRFDGSCFAGSALVEVFHRSPDIADWDLLWLKRPLVQACVDIGEMVKPKFGHCPVPTNVLSAAQSGLLTNDHTHIGCHRRFIPSVRQLTDSQITGKWLTVYRTGYDFEEMAACQNTKGPDGCTTQALLAQYSKTTEIVKTADGRLLVMSRYFNSTVWGACPPTQVLELTQNGDDADYSFTYPSHKGVYKVLYVDNDTAVVYWCHAYDSAGICRRQSLVVEILARPSNATILADKFQSLLQVVVNVCVEAADILPTASIAKCSIPDSVSRLAQNGNIKAGFDIPVVTCKGELLQGMPDLNAEKLAGEWNVFWRTDKFWGVEAPRAESSYIVPTYTGILYLWRSLDNELERCKPEEAGRYVRTASPGDYYSGFDGWPVVMKVLHTDYTDMLALWCHLDEQAMCHPDRTTVEILSKNATVENSTVEQLLASFDDSCLTYTDWMPSNPDTCRIENDVLTAAYIDGIGLEYSMIGCRKDLIQGQRGVTDDMLTGKWTSVLRAEPTRDEAQAARAIFHIVKAPEGPISVLFRLYNAEKEECLPAVLMSLRREKTDSASFAVGQERLAKILYADTDILTVLLCSHFLKDDTCDPDTQIFVVMAHDGREVDQALMEKMQMVGSDACVAPASLVAPSIDACHIPEDIVRDVSSGELQTDYQDVQCLARYIPVYKNFDVRDLLGAWFSRWETVYPTQPDSPVRAVSYHFVWRGEGTLIMLFTSERSAGATGVCLPTHLQTLEDGETDGTFVFSFQGSQALLKVVWLGEKTAVLYWCFKQRVDGLCEAGHLHVNVLSRQRQEQVEAPPLPLLPILADCCISKSDLTNVTSGGCSVPGDIVQALQDENNTVQAPSYTIQCSRQFVPVMEGFDVELFSGVWHTVRQTRFVWGNETWESSLRNFVTRSQGGTLMAFTGYQENKKSCVPTEVRTLRPYKLPGQWVYLEGETSVMVKVTWTDYVSSAVLYSCSGLGPDGLCDRQSLHVEVLSRSPRLQEGLQERLTAVLPLLCVREQDVETVATGLCKITEVVEKAVKAARNGGNVDSETPFSCRVQDIPLATSFQFLQITGYWYEIARTRFTFNTMESTISYYKHNPEKGYLDGLFIGTLQKQCQSALKSVTKKKFPAGPDSVITGRIQGPESIFPWITFNIIYFDGAFMMHFACYVENADGTCPRDKTEVTLLGRSRELSEDMEVRLGGLMESVCLSRDDLVTTQETADCLPMLLATSREKTDLPDTLACPLNDVPVVDNFSEEQVLGTWYGLGTVDYGAPGEASGFVVSLARSSPQTLVWKQWNVKNGSCHAEKAVYLKPACDGVTNGDYISTHGSSFMLQWSTVKILRHEADLMLVYWCTKETHGGACQPKGVRVDVLGRAKSAVLDVLHPLLQPLPSVCLAPENMQPLQATDICDKLAASTSPEVKLSPCAVDLLPTVSVDVEKIAGVWYELSHTVDPMFPLQKAVIYYRPEADSQLSMFLVALGPHGQCTKPMEGRMKPRCHSNPDSSFMGRLKFPGMWSWAPWRVLHAEYNTSLIALSCMDEQRDGSCSPQGSKLLILIRDPSRHAALRPTLDRLLHELGCFNHLPLEAVVHEGVSCKDQLKPVMAPATDLVPATHLVPAV